MDDFERNTYRDVNLDCYSEDLYDVVKDIVDSGDIKDLEPMYKTILWMFDDTKKKCILKTHHFNDFDYDFVPIALSHVIKPLDKVKFLRDFKAVCKKYNKEIKPETIMQIAQNVRKVEYYIDPETYPYDPESFFKISYMYAKHGGNNIDPSDLIRLMYKSGVYEKEIEQVKLAKTLRKVLETKQK